MEEFLESILPPFVVAFAVTATLGFLSRQAKVEITDRQLRYGSAVGVIGWFSLVFAIFVVSLNVLVVGDESPVPLYVTAGDKLGHW